VSRSKNLATTYSGPFDASRGDPGFRRAVFSRFVKPTPAALRTGRLALSKALPANVGVCPAPTDCRMSQTALARRVCYSATRQRSQIVLARSVGLTLAALHLSAASAACANTDRGLVLAR